MFKAAATAFLMEAKSKKAREYQILAHVKRSQVVKIKLLNNDLQLPKAAFADFCLLLYANSFQ